MDKDSQGNFDRDRYDARKMKSFKLKEESLSCPALEHNPIFKRLKSRLIKFFIEAERYRKHGPSAQ